MIPKLFPWILLVLFIFLLFFYGIHHAFLPTVIYDDGKVQLIADVSYRHYELRREGEVIYFDLVDPEMAPDDLLDDVMLGQKIMNQTKKVVSEHVNASLSCSNCHFNSGNSLGGKNGGISLVGVMGNYPSYSAREDRVISLEERINACFHRSMNGKPLPVDSKEMKAMVSYLDWISSEVVEIKNPPWRGMKAITIQHDPDVHKGELIYETRCSSCHGKEGNGGEGHYPPLWGESSFNDGAGLSTIRRLAPFIYLNMPHGEACLTEVEALDVSSYLLKQRRPLFTGDESN